MTLPRPLPPGAARRLPLPRAAAVSQETAGASLGKAEREGVRCRPDALFQMRKQDGGDRCHSRSSRDPQDHCVSCQARSRAADGGVIGLDDLLLRRATKSGTRLRGKLPCSPIRCCREDHREMMRCMRTVGSWTDSRIVDAGSGSQTAGWRREVGRSRGSPRRRVAINTLITNTLITS